MSAPPPASPTPHGRPRIVDVAFWSWLLAAVLTAALGLLQLSQPLPPFFRMVGVVLTVVGLAQGFLAGRARRGDLRFARAAAALALTTVVFDALMLAFFGAGIAIVILIAVTMLLLITGAVGVTRPEAQAWLRSRAE